MDRGAWQATVYGVTKSRTLRSDLQIAGIYVSPISHHLWYTFKNFDFKYFF